MSGGSGPMGRGDDFTELRLLILKTQERHEKTLETYGGEINSIKTSLALLWQRVVMMATLASGFVSVVISFAKDKIS